MSTLKKFLCLGTTLALAIVFLSFIVPAEAVVESSSITVLSPNGGEKLKVGETYRIKWDTSFDGDAEVDIGLCPTDEGRISWIAEDIQNTGFYDWTVGAENVGDSQFEVNVLINGNDGLYGDYSDNYFSIVSSGSTTPAPKAGYEDKVITNFTNYENPFSDTSADSLAGRAAIELHRRGVIGGFADGEFKGNQPVNRAEAAKFLLLARGITVDDLKNSGKFADVKEGEWYVKFVMKAAQKGIIGGHPDGTFRPADTVNTVEFLKMLTKTFDLQNVKHPYRDVPETAWFAPFVGIAASSDWSEFKNGYDLFPDTRSPTRLQPDRNLTREEVAIAIYQFLKNR